MAVKESKAIQKALSGSERLPDDLEDQYTEWLTGGGGLIGLDIKEKGSLAEALKIGNEAPEVLYYMEGDAGTTVDSRFMWIYCGTEDELNQQVEKWIDDHKEENERQGGQPWRPNTK
jgi:hypothetical protein